MDDQREKDKKVKLVPSTETRASNYPITLDQLKSVYICEGVTAEDLSKRFHLPVPTIQRFITEHKLDDLRAAYIKNGLEKLRSIQLVQAEQVLSVESKFKKMRLMQLEKMLEDYAAYFERHGDFYKRHPITGEILKDSYGIPMQLSIPNVSKEVLQLKETFTLSEGLKGILNQIDEIINKPKDVEQLDPNTIDMETFDGFFKKTDRSEDDND